MDYINLAINFVSASADVENTSAALTFDATNFVWIIPLVILSVCFASCLFCQRKKEFSTRNIFGTNKSFKNAKHAKTLKTNNLCNNTQFTKLFIIAVTILLSLSAIGFFVGKNAFANEGSLQPDTDKITATVYDDGSVSFSTCNLTNVSSEIYSLDQASVSVSDEAKSVVALATSTFTINGFDGVVYKGNPDGQFREAFNVVPLPSGEATQLSFALEGLNKDNLMSLVDKNVFSISLKPIKVYEVNFDVQGHGIAPASYLNIKEGDKIPSPTDPTETGWIFDGWYKEKDCINQWLFDIDIVTENTTLYAKWTPRTDTPYTVEHYKQNLDDTWPAQPFETDHLTGTTGSEVTPETKNYEGFTPPQIEPVVIKADGLLVVKYYYVRNSYEVSFDENGHGIAPDKQTIKYEGLVTKPENPTEPGYIFEDWYKEPECTNKWNFENDKILGKTILYANWEIDQNTSYKVEHFKQKIDGFYSDIPDDVDELTGPTDSKVTPDTKNYTGFKAPEKQTVTISADGSTVVDYEYTRNSYTVTFDANGHGTSPQATDVKYEDKATQPEEPQAEGYIFSGWYKESECINEWVFAEEQVTRDTTLWAKWTEKSGYSVKYDPDGGSDVSPLTNLRWTSDNLLPAKNPEKQGYEFIGWFYGNDKSIQATSATKYWEIASSAEEDEVTIYAKWSPNENTPYKVWHFKQNIDGTYPKDPADVDSLSGTTGTEVTAETKTYYGFTSPQKLTVVISADGLTVVNYLYTRNSYTVSFDSNGHGSAPETETVKFEDFAIAPTNEPTETGYTFNGWYKESECSNQWNFAEDTVIGDTILYAKWTANTYIVSFNNNGHGTTPAPKNVTYDSAYGELPVLTDEGYILAGWYLDELFSESNKVDADTVVKTAENHTLYAKWEERTGTVSFVTNGHGGSTPQPINVTYDKAYGDLPSLTENGYTFGGWYLDQEFTPEKKVEPSTIVKTVGDHNLYAKWIANTYTVSFNNGGHGQTPAPIQVTYDSVYGEQLVSLSDDNLLFVGWLDENGSAANTFSVYKIAHDSILTAQWQQTAKMYYGYQDTANGKILYLAGCSTANAPTNCSSALAAQAATDCPWNDQRTNITSVIVETYIYPTSTAYWFTDLSSCSVFNITQLDTANVTNMRDMFASCSAVQNIDVSNWDTSKVESMKRMFGKCQKLLKLDLSNWNTAKVKDMSNMFQLCTNLTAIDLYGFNTSSVTDMSYMFSACWNLGVLNISTFNTANVTDMQHMFNSCWKMQTIFASELFNTSKVTDDNSMFFDCEKLVGGNGTKYNKDHVNKEYAVIDGLNGKPGYFSKQTINYQVCIWGIGQDKCGVDGSDTANLTFGPATGETNACLDVDGHHEHCIHNESWETIINNCNNGHADWYQNCLKNGCTKSVPIILNSYIGESPKVNEFCSILHSTSFSGHLLSTYVKWNDSYSSSNCESANWATSRIRATLNGKTGNESKYAGEDCLDSSNCLLSCFPVNLRNAIKPKYYQVPTTWSVKDPYSIETSVFVSDKLWLMSGEEVYGQAGIPNHFKEFEKAQYTKKQNEGTTWGSYSKNIAYVWSISGGSPEYWWLRSPYRYYRYYAGYVNHNGDWYSYYVYNTYCGLSPCFCL